MITIKSKHELKIMQKAGQISKAALLAAGDLVAPGVTTRQLDEAARRVIEKAGAKPAFLGYGGFPATICCSINDEVIHGIPGDRVIQEGDIVSIDTGAIYEGYYGDNAATFGAGKISEEAQKLIDVTRQSFYEGIKFARKGQRISDISHAIGAYCEARGYGVVREFVGHGIGTKMHEAPEIPNFGAPGHGPRLMPGMTLAIEPMINMGTWKVKVLPDGWTVKTLDGSLSAHYENTVLITEGEPIILTSVGD
ncbi:type I methionyl aminopeptidase [Intestinimonas sp. MSJ-38]|uniref:type I methionyl aminopeptidase n=1 Tax=Intestinimonas sp. MSJ-38 TaxID=2841532 RepID=UPI000E4A686A|nr:type I methionyl aminopeptidase [Intestinimonas sp. MSJ-38]MBU5433416.1 type I methionyl aminopeptidase [Intestinimonas sp. MSJ-38]RHO53061.1 type I methionyl aminopeptidase [Ruminococcaceae bacterium AM07-15]RHT71437.1 type I methionyl aminopeptidase [Ruminococcaceae bacterium AM28-23LB]